MSHSQNNTLSKLFYTLLLVPFALAYLSWAFFPEAVRVITVYVFDYHPFDQVANFIWLALTNFFYTWYTLLAIGIAGTWIVTAFLARKKRDEIKHQFLPTVSFVVPAYNEEANVQRCIASLCKCAEEYWGHCEIIVVDDGSYDNTYENALSAASSLHVRHPKVRFKISRHMLNLGKTEALKTGVNRALGQMIAIVDGDSEWMPETLKRMVDYKISSGKKAVTGYIHPQSAGSKDGFIIALQQLEYSQGLGIDRCAQSFGNCVLVVPGAIGLYDADLLREILIEVNIRSVTEDAEITLEMYKRGAQVSYLSTAHGSTVVPTLVSVLWRQRLRWFTGWLHNVFDIHIDLFRKRSRLSAFLWYSFLFEFVGAFIDLAALAAFPFLLWFAPDRLHFAYNLLVFLAYGLLISLVNQAFALKYAYGRFNHKHLLFYTPFFPFLWIINLFARLWSITSYLLGNKGR